MAKKKRNIEYWLHYKRNGVIKEHRTYTLREMQKFIKGIRKLKGVKLILDQKIEWVKDINGPIILWQAIYGD